jgi:DNA invertase Pin-like site-specific DNA recombinase
MSRRKSLPSDCTTALGYCRVSTDEQVRDGVSLDVQRERIRAYAEAKGFALAAVLVDEGVSGKRLERPGLRELLERCQRGNAKHVIVWKLDRLTRRTRDLLTLIEEVFLAQQVELHSVNESLDTSTPHGRFVLTLFGGLAQMERELIGERTRGALAFKREQRHPTSHPPLGFRTNGKRHRMVPVPEELRVVRCILERPATAVSVRTIRGTGRCGVAPSRRTPTNSNPGHPPSSALISFSYAIARLRSREHARAASACHSFNPGIPG